MNSGWQTKKLGELCEIELGKTPARANAAFWDEKRETSNVWLSIADLLKAEDDVVIDSKEYLSDQGAEICKLVPKGTLLVSFKLTLGRLAFAGRDLFTNEAIAALTIFNERELSKEFLFYFLHFFDWVKAAENDVKLKGMTLNKAKLKEMSVHFPTMLSEQRRIVGFLDEAFDNIATARAHAEQNRRNARALFDSYLQAIFTLRGEGWLEKRIPDICLTFGRGKSRHRPRNEPTLYGGDHPFIQTGDLSNADHVVTTYSQTYSDKGLAQSKLWPKGTVGIAIVGATIGETAVLGFDACFPDSVIGMTVNPTIADPYFLEYMLQNFKGRVKSLGEGSARENINLGTFDTLLFPMPPVAEQRLIAERVDRLKYETQRLESLYQRKLTALDELKKSLLHRAFSGQLTASASPAVSVPLVSIPFPTTVPGIATTDLHAGILAMACRLHDEKGKLDQFTHVKAEKIAHMVEAWPGIDLGRTPVKDAAGPNDFPHLKKVEHRARMTKAYDFQQVNGGPYRVKRLAGFDRLIEKTTTALGDRCAEIERLLNWMMPLSVQQAEIVATVFAGWNNLLLEEKQPTDEEIVFESRENWHPNKLNIDREKFFKAVAWLRKEGVVPQGRGKRVGAKGK